MRTLNESYEMVPVARLKPHPDNPRRGDLAVIKESMRANGWYGFVVAQRSTSHVLVGNHRLEAFRGLGGREVPTIWVECSEPEALRILAADNRTNDLASYDEPRLREVLEIHLRETGSLAGTGWTANDLQAISHLLEPEAPPEAAGGGGPPGQLTCPRCGTSFPRPKKGAGEAEAD